ncbi:unnamed protein product, partial [Mesorhabditis spiculigera]
MVAGKMLPQQVLSSIRQLSFTSQQLKKMVANEGTSRYLGQPPLTVPDPEITLKKFLDYATALAANGKPGQHQVSQNTSDILKTIKKFREEEMPTLQKLLEERGSKLQNWLTPWWLDVAYLAARTPLPVVTSPGVLFPRFPVKHSNPVDVQIHYATAITLSALQFYQAVESGALPQDMAGKAPMDMSQYKFLFGTTRVPRKSVDQIKYGFANKNPNKHIVVMRNGHAVVVPVVTNGTEIRDHAVIEQAIRQAYKLTEAKNPHQIGIISGGERDNWAGVYKKLEGDINNAENLKAIEEALFVVCLDAPTEPPNGHSEKDEQARSALHGSGSTNNSGNRWFDKTIQFIIADNGYCGMTYEHTPAEGPPIARLMDFVCDKINAQKYLTNGDTQPVDVRLLKFILEDSVKDAVARSAKEMDKVVEDLEVRTYSFKNYGKNFPKQLKLSPDSFIQMAFQLAYYRLYNKVPPTYETATLRLFAEGRTENIRLPSVKSRNMCEAMQSTDRSDTEKYQLFREAAEYHKDLAKDCMANKGMDRHLLAWRLLASENKLPAPSICQTESFKEMTHFRVSTSQVPTKNFIQMCFGPSDPDCYGICYNPQETELHFTVTAFNQEPTTSAKRFVAELGNTFNDLERLCGRFIDTKPKSKL